ncbi:hypothetical protein UlMin_001561 [Ulmus minor]
MEEEDKNSTVLPFLLSSELPTINFNNLITCNSHQTKSIEVAKIHQACNQLGFFHIINHGITKRVIEDALGSASKFFELPMEEKNMFSADDVHKPVRFSAIRSLDDNGDKLSRDFLKLYAHPIQDWIGSWPSKPADYRENVGKFAVEIKQLGTKVLEAIMESVGLNPNYSQQSFQQGMQIIAINSYQKCPPSTNIVGIQSHTDHSIITILIETNPGLEILDKRDNSWKLVPTKQGDDAIDGLIVLVGNHLEVLSNGIYKSVVHRVVTSSKSSRVSLASLHSLSMDEMVEPALDLVDEENPKRYRASSVSDYLTYLSSKEAKPYIESLKI